MNTRVNKTNDPYRWLEKDSSRTKAWIKKEQEETSEYLSQLPKRKELKKQFSKLFQVDSMRMPNRVGKYIFFRFRKANEEETSLYVKRGLKGKPRLLLNPSKLPKKDRAVIGDWTVSKDARLIVIELSKAGNDKSEIRIFEVKSRKFLKDRIPSEHYPDFICWNVESTGFWYRLATGKKPEEKYFKRIYFHKVGQPLAKDKLFFGDGLPKVDWPYMNKSYDGRYIVVTVQQQDKTTYSLFYDTHRPEKGFVKITQGIKADSWPFINGSYIYLLTDHKAPNKKVIRREIRDGSLGPWKSYIRESKYALEGCRSVSGYLILNYLVNVSSKVFIVNLQNGKKRELPLPCLGTVSSFSTDFDTRETYMYFSSFNTPPTIYSVNIQKLTMQVYWKLKIPVQTKNIVVKQEWYRSKDGTRIPMFIVHKKGIKQNGSNPTLVYAYGGYGISETPDFNTAILPFVEDGGIYALVNIRGGGEFGESWHKPFIKKKRYKIYEDFEYALKYLTAKKYTNSNKIAIWGGSNGGLLVSMTMLLHPQLIKTAIISVPVTDMLRYHLFNGGRWWISEYGDPDNKSMRKYLLKWSPYHIVDMKNYPTAFITTADHDDRVHPMHSYKFTARLKSNPAQKNKIHLRVESRAGHSGASKVTPFVEKISDMFAFVYKELEMW